MIIMDLLPTEKYFRLIIFFLIFLSPIIFVYVYFPDDTGNVIAILIGIAAILQNLIIKIFLPPLFDIKIKELPTMTLGGENQKWYNLSIKNRGFSGAENLRIKIKDGESKSWINLLKPFSKFLSEAGLSSLKIDSLSSGEEENFNIGHIGLDNCFILQTNVSPNNQNLRILAINKCIYYCEIVADNANPHPFILKIENNGYKDFNIANIKICK